MEKYKVIERSKDSGSTHSLLNKGMVPGIVYGKGTEPTKIAFENKVLLKLMHTGAFYSTILDLDIEGKNEKVLPKQLQYHPITDKLIKIGLAFSCQKVNQIPFNKFDKKLNKIKM